MKKLKKAILILAIIAGSLTAIMYGGVFLGHRVIFPEEISRVPTIEAVTDGIFTFGPQAHPTQPESIEEYVVLLSAQLKKYNEIASDLWHDNALAEQSIIVEEYAKGRFWHISVSGTVTSLTRNEALDFGISRQRYVDGFSTFDGGIYLAVHERDLNNYLLWQEYLHLGTYDSFITFAHEGFHIIVQSNWSTMENIPNLGRDEFLENTHARAKRALLQEQLLRAVSEPGNMQLILEALSTYVSWKSEFPEEYENSIDNDRIEGTAYYFELVTALYSGYREQIKNKDDLDNALALLATRNDIYVWHGLVKEGYIIGGFSGVLLDRYAENWAELLVNDPYATPIEMLYRHFISEVLPAPQQLTQADIDAIGEKIQENEQSRILSRLFRFFYDLLF